MDKKRGKIIGLLIAIIVIALFLEAGILYYVNNKNTEKTTKVLLNQVVDIIKKNQKNEDEMMSSLKEDYIVRAKAVSYMIDAKPEAERNKKELQKIADLMSIDEIHLFDKTGKIYSGTIAKYYGYSFDSGKQLAYFKPMLKNKKMTMCQDVTPNTSEKKEMMYAITWNESGDRMIQVGIKSVRLLEEVKQNEVDSVISNMPVYKGISIYVADKDSGKIYGATDRKQIGKTLDQIGIKKQNIDEKKTFIDIIRVEGKKSKCIMKNTGKYVAGVTFAIESDNTSNLIALMIVAVYLVIASAFILVMVSRLSKVKKEKKEQSEMLSSISEISNTDELTGCFNRRAYEEDVANLSSKDQFIYVSMDVNGLKIVNDSKGHVAGDELLLGASSCMKQAYDPYGKVYRIGGDEFIAILPVNREQFAWIKMEFDRIVNVWKGEHVKAMSISSGFISSSERQWTSIKELANIADIRMYEEKAMYYKKNGIDRQGQPASYVALYRLYTQILKIDLKKDKYRMLNWKENKKQEGCLSEWLEHFEEIEKIHPDDRQEYKEKTQIEYLKQQFNKETTFVMISYRRKEGDEYKRVTIEIVPEDQYLYENSEGFLYVKG